VPLLLRKGVIILAVWLAGFICTLWWEIEWKRHMRIHVRTDSQDRPWRKILFRLYFAVRMLGKLFGLRLGARQNPDSYVAGG
jgi:hypothetical protein